MVSVLMTSYNREKFIKESIESILRQDYKDFEFVIVDDASSDATWKIILDYAKIDKRIRAFRNDFNLGDYPNRNRAVSYATRKYIKYLDSDDILEPYGLSMMVEGMERNPSAAIGLVGIGLGLQRNQLALLNPVEVFRLIFFKGKIIGCGPSFSIIKKSVFDEIGGFLPNRHLSDLELWFRLLPFYPLVVFEESLIYWRRHPDQEFEIGEKTNFHLVNSYTIYERALNGENCPLPEIEKKLALRNLRNRYSRNVFLSILSGKFKLACQLQDIASIGLLDLLQALFPNRYPIISDHQNDV